jgi:hypothetical protein
MSGERFSESAAQEYKDRQQSLKELFNGAEQWRKSGKTLRSAWRERDGVHPGFNTKFIGEYEADGDVQQMEITVFSHRDGETARITGSETPPVLVTKQMMDTGRIVRYTSSQVSEDTVTQLTHRLAPENGLVPDEEAMGDYIKKMRRFSYGTRNNSTHKPNQR